MDSFDLHPVTRTERIISSSEPERPDVDSKVRRKTTLLAVRILAYILLAAVIGWLLFVIFVHPVDRLKLWLLTAQKCSIKIHRQQGPASGEATVQIDGNRFSIIQGQDWTPSQYFELVDGKLYTFRQNPDGQWRKVESHDITVQDGASFAKLFDRNNYSRADGELFVWQLKEGVVIDGLTDVRFMRRNGKFTITANVAGEYLSYVTFVVEQIGTTEVDFPWEKS